MAPATSASKSRACCGVGLGERHIKGTPTTLDVEASDTIDYVKASSSKISTLDVEASDTIDKVKIKIQDLHQQRLSSAGHSLKLLAGTLSDHNIQNNLCRQAAA